MLQTGELYFNNNTNLNLNLFLEEYPSIPRLNENYEKVTVEGRSGDLFINLGTYPDREIKFNFTILSDDIPIDFDEVEEWLTNVEDNRLFWGNEDKYFLVKKVVIGDLAQEFKTIGTIDATFICEPFRLDHEEIVYSITETGFEFLYLGNIAAEPIIQVWGNGNIQMTINGETMQIDNVEDYFEIDSKLLQVRNFDGTSKDGDTLGDFPLFSNGINTIAFSSNAVVVKVYYTTRYK